MNTNFVLAGDGTSCNNDPGNNGLGELFSYVIENTDEDIIVTIIRGDRGGEVINSVVIDLDELDAGYYLDDKWNYFKAGAYTQNDRNSNARNGDSDIVTLSTAMIVALVRSVCCRFNFNYKFYILKLS